MKKTILYIAESLDGYIADRNGSVDWIKGQDDSVEPEDTFTPSLTRLILSSWGKGLTTRL